MSRRGRNASLIRVLSLLPACHRPGPCREPRRNALVVLRWSDWCDLHGTPRIPLTAEDMLLECETPPFNGQDSQ